MPFSKIILICNGLFLCSKLLAHFTSIVVHSVVMLFRRVFIIYKLLPHFTSIVVCCVVALAVWKAVQPHGIVLLKLFWQFWLLLDTHFICTSQKVKPKVITFSYF